jgi:hypothetical protein
MFNLNIKVMFSKYDLIEVLALDACFECIGDAPENIYKSFFNNLIKITIEEVIKCFEKKGQNITYVGCGMFMYR